MDKLFELREDEHNFELACGCPKCFKRRIRPLDTSNTRPHSPNEQYCYCSACEQEKWATKGLHKDSLGPDGCVCPMCWQLQRVLKLSKLAKEKLGADGVLQTEEWFDDAFDEMEQHYTPDYNVNRVRQIVDALCLKVSNLWSTK